MDKLKLFISDPSVIPQKAANFLSYLLGSGLVVGDVMNYLNHNAAAIGALCVVATTIVNWWYKPSREKDNEL